MTPGERLKLFRILHGFTQQELAAAGNITQRNYGQLENKSKIAPNYINIYSVLLGLNSYYLGSGKIDIIFNNRICLFHVPPKQFSKYRDDRSVFVRKMNEFQNICEEYLPSFLNEAKAERYFILYSSTDYLLYVFQLINNQYLIICSDNNHCKILNKAAEAFLEKANEITVDSSFTLASDDLEILQIVKSYLESIGDGIPDYIIDEWKTSRTVSNYYKILLKDTFWGTVDYTELNKVIDDGTYFKIKFLVPKFRLGRIVKKADIETSTYAIAIQDQDNNIYVFRRISKFSFFASDKLLQIELNSRIANTVKKIIYSVIEIEKPLYDKIKNWTISRDDIEPILTDNLLSLEENELIKYIRENNIAPRDAIDYIKSKIM